MSIKSWKAEYYPVTAYRLAHNGASVADLLKHSIRKWMGATQEALERHGLAHVGKIPLDFGADDCALCRRFVNDCEGCPARPCRRFVNEWEPWPMIWHLRKALKKVQKKSRAR